MDNSIVSYTVAYVLLLEDTAYLSKPHSSIGLSALLFEKAEMECYGVEHILPLRVYEEAVPLIVEPLSTIAAWDFNAALLLDHIGQIIVLNAAE